MRYLRSLVLILISWNMCALRDPFCYGDGAHRYVCAGIGNIDYNIFFARIYKDGLEYTVCLHDMIDKDEVVSITQASVTLLNKQGDLHTLVLVSKKNDITSKKRPFNLGKLKG